MPCMSNRSTQTTCVDYPNDQVAYKHLLDLPATKTPSQRRRPTTVVGICHDVAQIAETATLVRHREPVRTLAGPISAQSACDRQTVGAVNTCFSRIPLRHQLCARGDTPCGEHGCERRRTGKPGGLVSVSHRVRMPCSCAGRRSGLKVGVTAARRHNGIVPRVGVLWHRSKRVVGQG